MNTLQIDNKGNLRAVGNFTTLTEVEAVKQDIKTLLKLFGTEYPFDNRIGIPYYNLSARNNKELIRSSVIARALEDDRVQSVSRCDVSFVKGTMQISLDVILKNGVVVNV